MPKTTITPPLLISILAVLTLLLICQDVTAQQRSVAVGRSKQTVEPVDPAEAPAEAEPAQEPVIGTTTAQKPVIGTMTVDGETRSIVIEDCKVLPGGGERIRVDGAGKDDAGSTLSYTFSYGRFNIRTSTGRYMTRDRDGKMVFQVDGSKVTLDGMFATDSKARPDHSIQLSFDCTG